MKVLVVDDEKLKRMTLRDDLRESGYDVIAVESPLIGLQLLQQEAYDVLVTDLRMPQMHGIDFLKRVKKEHPHITVIVMTAYASVETAVEALRFGAYNYIKKPFSSDALIAMLEKLKALKGKTSLEMSSQSSVQASVRNHESSLYHTLIGKSQQIQEIFDQVPKIAAADSNVMIYGEEGTGKSLLAKTIHLQSSRKHAPYVSLNCYGLNADAVELELFGDDSRQGKLQLSTDGTLFIANVDTIPISLQAKLLAALEDRSLAVQSEEETLAIDVRIISTSRENLKDRTRSGEFLEDLYYQLNVIPLYLPPLRERKGDIPMLINHFIDIFSSNQPVRIQPEAVRVLTEYSWPGNVSELENIIERLVGVNRGTDITAEEIPIEYKLPTSQKFDDTPSLTSFHEIIKTTERELIAWAMRKTKGNKTQAARLLSMKPSTFRDTLAKHIQHITLED
ncbi:sigma-54-dependent Fis family transcriptional regulator [Candidatus Poribacteria bacterium]|nr:sigma-54-dependent Fis family transcriptional regulator [Candidatus Poribacteria bacterium]MYB63622.1 sigma-54-dependent Fis family transcriptional regulator [Candidatus Poribacteria bacterium]